MSIRFGDMNYTAPQSSVVDPTQRIGDISSPLLRNYGAGCGTEEDTHEVKPGLVLALESSPRKFLCWSPRLTLPLRGLTVAHGSQGHSIQAVNLDIARPFSF